MLNEYKKLRADTLARVTVEDIENYFTKRSLIERLENIDKLLKLWFDFFIKSEKLGNGSL